MVRHLVWTYLLLTRFKRLNWKYKRKTKSKQKIRKLLLQAKHSKTKGYLPTTTSRMKVLYSSIWDWEVGDVWSKQLNILMLQTFVSLMVFGITNYSNCARITAMILTHSETCSYHRVKSDKLKRLTTKFYWHLLGLISFRNTTKMEKVVGKWL